MIHFFSFPCPYLNCSNNILFSTSPTTSLQWLFNSVTWVQNKLFLHRTLIRFILLGSVIRIRVKPNIRVNGGEKTECIKNTLRSTFSSFVTSSMTLAGVTHTSNILHMFPWNMPERWMEWFAKIGRGINPEIKRMLDMNRSIIEAEWERGLWMTSKFEAQMWRSKK